MASLFDLPFEEPPPEPSAPPPAPERRRVLTVTELTARIRALLEERFIDVWVEGELSNCRVWNTGHMYFTLKDEASQIKAVMFRSALRYLRFAPQDGLQVVARGRLSVYDPKGEYQMICEHFEPAGLGALQLAFDQLKRRLAGEGLFDQQRKRPLPALPRKIGLVTSTDGAAVRDIIKVLRRRHPNAHIVIRPTRVQGDGAANEVARAISAIAKVPGVDVVIVARGGGSIEDLWAFNEEVVARALARCPIPTISAIGHETDVTIADFVADLRAPTPSAAAEMVVARKDDFCGHIDRLHRRLASGIVTRMHLAGARLRSLEAAPAYAGLGARVALRGRHASELAYELRRTLAVRIAAQMRSYQSLRLALERLDFRRRLGTVRMRLAAVDGKLAAASLQKRHAARVRLRDAAARLDSLSPLAVLGRGYAVCWTGDRSAIIRDASSVAIGDRVRITVAKGELSCEVTGRDDAKPSVEASTK